MADSNLDFDMASALDYIVDVFERNRTFAANAPAADYDIHDPEVVTISCCDARVPQKELFGSGPGENFTVAKIGNAVLERDGDGEPILAGSVLYPIEKTDPTCAIVVGHTDCGAVTAAWQQVAGGAGVEGPALQNELDLLLPVIEEGLEQFDADRRSADEQITRLVEYNVDRQVEALLSSAEIPVLGVVCDLHGFYTEQRASCHLVNYDGARSEDAIPEPLAPVFRRKLSY